MNHIRRGAYLASLLALLGTSLGARASVAAPVPSLGGVTVITASRPVLMDVRLTRAVTVATPGTSSPDLTIKPAGRLTSVVLIGHHTSLLGLASDGGTTYLMPLSREGGAGPSDVLDGQPAHATTTRLDAGTYRLYVVPSGRTTITLKLHGVSGRATLAPRTPATAEVAGADGPVPATAAPGQAAATVTRALPRGGLALQYLRASFDASLAWQLLLCHDNPDQTPGRPGTLPGCPSGKSQKFTEHRYPEQRSAHEFVQAFADLAPGTHGLSAVYTSEALATSPDYVSLWLSY